MKAPKQKWYINYTYILAGLILTIYAMIVAKSILLPLLFAIFFSILLSPFCDWLEKYKIPRVIAAIVAILTAFLVLAGLGFLFYSQLAAFVEDIDMIQQRLEELVEGAESFLVAWVGIDALIELESIEAAIIDFIRDNTAALTRGIAGAAAIITAMFLVPIYMFLLLIFRDFLQEFLLQVFGRKDDDQLQRIKTIIERVKLVVQHYIMGIVIVIFILAIINTSMLMLVGVNHAIFFGVFAAMLNVIPFLGPIFGSILPIVYALITMDSLIYPIIILVSFYIIQLFESNLFTPVIVGSKVSLNALVTLLLLFIGAQIWGLAGMILFIPMGAILKVIFDEIESMRPYGFIMGRVPAELHKKKGPLAKKISDFSKHATEENSGK
jgi:predicted PurR-regulated permease PerM